MSAGGGRAGAGRPGATVTHYSSFVLRLCVAAGHLLACGVVITGVTCRRRRNASESGRLRQPRLPYGRIERWVELGLRVAALIFVFTVAGSSTSMTRLLGVHRQLDSRMPPRSSFSHGVIHCDVRLHRSAACSPCGQLFADQLPDERIVLRR